jgi:hypothetical protein
MSTEPSLNGWPKPGRREIRRVGGHYNTFLALPLKRSSCEYDFAGGVSDTDAERLLETVRRFTVDAKDSIKARDPRLAQ